MRENCITVCTKTFQKVFSISLKQKWILQYHEDCDYEFCMIWSHPTKYGFDTNWDHSLCSRTEFRSPIALKRKLSLFIWIWVKKHEQLSKNKFYSEAVSRRCSVKKMFLKLSQSWLFRSLFFNKVVGLRPATLWKKDSNTGAFLWILQNF